MRSPTEVPAESPRPADDDPPVLRIVETPGQGQVDLVVPVEAPILLGRAPGPKGLALFDPRVSGVHLTVYPGDDGQLLFRDMGSTNGTFHNGRRAAGATLCEGDLLRLGSTLLVVTRRGPAFDAEALGDGLIGQSPAFRGACARADAVARTSAPVLLWGEPGSGTERLARFVHTHSGRQGPFVVVRGAALSGPLAAAALFGQEQAVASGAARARLGAFREADGGTLLLDELDLVAGELQPLLLRALEHREVVPVGATRAVPVDVRVIAASGADLPRRVAEGRLRADLYAGLNASPLTLPPLRARREDILRLARHFAGRAPDRVRFGDPVFEPDLAEVLALYRWPANVRELRETVAWLVQGAGLPLPLDRLPRRIIDDAVPPPPPGRLPDALALATRTAPLKVAEAHRRKLRPTKDELLAALAAHGFNISAVARAFDRDRKQIYRWVAHYDITLPAEADGT